MNIEPRISTRTKWMIGGGTAAFAPTAAALVFAVLALTTSGCQGKHSDSSTSAPSLGASANRSPDASTPPRTKSVNTLPPDPPPPHSDLAHEVPNLEKKLADDAAYEKLWKASRGDVNLFLTYVSELLAEGGAPIELANAMRGKGLKEAAIALFLIHARVGHFPEGFTKSVNDHLDATRTEARRGTWSPDKKGAGAHDYTALAAWLRREDATYLRERIIAKKSGPTRWNVGPRDSSPYPWLTFAPEALARLALLGALQPEDCLHGGMDFVEHVNVETGSTSGACQPSLPATIREQRRAALVTLSDLASIWPRKAVELTPWPFALDYGWIECRFIARGMGQVVLHAGGEVFGLNGLAIGDKSYAKIDRIWLDDPTLSTKGNPMKISIQGAIAVGLGLCRD